MVMAVLAVPAATEASAVAVGRPESRVALAVQEALEAIAAQPEQAEQQARQVAERRALQVRTVRAVWAGTAATAALASTMLLALAVTVARVVLPARSAMVALAVQVALALRQAVTAAQEEPLFSARVTEVPVALAEVCQGLPAARRLVAPVAPVAQHSRVMVALAVQAAQQPDQVALRVRPAAMVAPVVESRPVTAVWVASVVLHSSPEFRRVLQVVMAEWAVQRRLLALQVQAAPVVRRVRRVSLPPLLVVTAVMVALVARPPTAARVALAEPRPTLAHSFTRPLPSAVSVERVELRVPPRAVPEVSAVLAVPPTSRV